MSERKEKGFNPGRRRILQLSSMAAGMLAGERVLAVGHRAASALAQTTPTTRHYYVTAENVSWSFVPQGKDAAMGMVVPTYAKTAVPMVRYVQYTDGTYTTKKNPPSHMGLLGPVIRAVVGDTIVVHFLNKSNIPCSMHPHGVRYDKASEGAYYSYGGAGGKVDPGQSYTYTWLADADSGPGPNDPSSVVWWYHSHTDERGDVAKGLMGPIVITAAGKAKSGAIPNDVSRELFLSFMNFLPNGGMVGAINGRAYGNVSSLSMNAGEKVRWYVMGMGEESDMHPCHWHGHTLLHRGNRTDVIELMPGSMKVLDMNATNVGTWLIHCHVGMHMHMGMTALYTVNPV